MSPAPLHLVRLAPQERAERYGARRGRYELHEDDGRVRWTVEVDLESDGAPCFWEEALWCEAGVVAVGALGVVVLLDLNTGAERLRVEVPSGFGHLRVEEVDGQSWLFIFGWQDVHALGPDLKLRWTSRQVAVDGIVFRDLRGEVLSVSAEMDPPGGWFDVRIDVHTGRELGREPDFSEDYNGIYGTGSAV